MDVSLGELRKVVVDREAWHAAIHGVSKSRTRLSNLTFTFHFPALEKEMATPSSVLAWRLPWTGKPGGLQSTGVAESRTGLSDVAQHIIHCEQINSSQI